MDLPVIIQLILVSGTVDHTPFSRSHSLSSGFKGCISDLTVDGQSLSLYTLSTSDPTIGCRFVTKGFISP